MKVERMKFLKNSNGVWCQFDDKKMKTYNFHGGYCDINESSLGNCKVVEYEDWHDLYINTKYNPLIGDFYHTGWISPEGNFYPCNAHEVAADEILELIYGENYSFGGDELIEKGWIKVTTSLMFDIYEEKGYYCKMSKEQEKTFDSWAKKYKK